MNKSECLYLEDLLHSAKEYAARAATGKRHDPGHMYPMTLTQKEKRDSYQYACELIDKVIIRLQKKEDVEPKQ
jgi:hypothetical protein